MKEGVEEIEKSNLERQITNKLLKDFQLTLKEFIIKGNKSVKPEKFLEFWNFIDETGLNQDTKEIKNEVGESNCHE